MSETFRDKLLLLFLGKILIICIFSLQATGVGGTGLSFSSGETWKEHRAVTANIFRALGVGRNILLSKVVEVVEIQNEIIAGLEGQPTDLDDIITTSVANIICSILFGHRFDYGDKGFIKAFRIYKENIYEADGSNLANYFKFWSYIPGDLFGAKRIQTRAQYFMTNFVEPFVKKKGYDEFDENNLDNFIAMYIADMNKKLRAGEPTSMSHESLKKTIYDVFGAGMETLATTVKWSILYLLHYPEIQEKIHNEIMREVGLERAPTINDKPQLRYLNAFVLEVQRVTSIVPLNIFRVCTDDLPVGGYVLLKGTQIISSLDSILLDKRIWGEDVYVLRPERFLDACGEVKCPEQFVPFSMGKRACPGEALAKVEMFCFFSSLIQRFRFVPEDPHCLPPLTAIFGLTAIPAPYKVRALDRKSQR